MDKIFIQGPKIREGSGHGLGLDMLTPIIVIVYFISPEKWACLVKK